MSIILLSDEKDLLLTGQDIVRIFFPDEEVIFDSNNTGELTLFLSSAMEGRKLFGAARLTDSVTSIAEEASSDEIPMAGDERNNQKRLVKLALYRLLHRHTGFVPGPWGILTGIRPTKIVHRLLDLSWDDERIASYLVNEYEIAHPKARLLAEIAGRQRQYLLPETKALNTVSIYIGIPFCPTRCIYCSFPSYPVRKYANLLEPFLYALDKEIKSIGNVLSGLNKKVQTIYIGGGTPTTLDDRSLDSLLQTIGKYLVSDGTVEITMEAGRPDTVTVDKLVTAKENGVTRLSINPQSMNSETLDRIGRRHTPEQVLEAVDLARKMGFDFINMDIIIGLPGERIEDVQHTLHEIMKLRPENLTVHTLAVKRASHINENREDYKLPSLQEVQRMHEAAAAWAGEMGMHPYYLYRQKKMVGPFENIGYALQDHDCVYNIQIIEERQTIIGLGSGAGTKYVEPGTWYLTSHYNPKDPETYINRIDDIIEKKIKKLEETGGIK